MFAKSYQIEYEEYSETVPKVGIPFGFRGKNIPPIAFPQEFYESIPTFTPVNP
ncbi:MAG: hypothetical protein UT08_C0007G0010 [Candidatus Woesebacteria bacterium GW2011_GWB1_38_8]|uniref:Uncharacterized protein n=1 Tax=Candidatus Woesebacteria bacterium GW2011_GWB1_38_8 TaxID=1618570 RepID=A0A0G0L2V0_9BACT|nr:MAG: hypothetical protein UT08_C0007G0010 [Candidatus Woesebacteria bacterium GW2011_GWB1_38_8]